MSRVLSYNTVSVSFNISLGETISRGVSCELQKVESAKKKKRKTSLAVFITQKESYVAAFGFMVVHWIFSGGKLLPAKSEED